MVAAATIAVVGGVGVLAVPGSSGAPAVAVNEVDIATAVVRGPDGSSRGPAAGMLPDGRVLLGGGADGRSLLVVDPATGGVRDVGKVIRADQRRDDARFAPTDIEVMATSPGQAKLYISYPQYLPARNCVRLAVDRVDITTGPAPAVRGSDPVFRSRPCVRPNAIQHASGRLVRIAADRAYVTIGDLGSPLIAKRKARGQLGTVQRIGEGVKAVRISQGHRNSQGLARDSLGRLWLTEHGPRGGDELNLVRRGVDYGWPFVTLGRPYGDSDYVMPRRTGTHVGYRKPRTSWVPSVATSELVEVPASWPGQSSSGTDLLVGTLADESLWHIQVDRSGKVTGRERIGVGHRVRDLEVSRDGAVLASTDSGKLLVVRPG